MGTLFIPEALTAVNPPGDGAGAGTLTAENPLGALTAENPREGSRPDVVGCSSENGVLPFVSGELALLTAAKGLGVSLADVDALLNAWSEGGPEEARRASGVGDVRALAPPSGGGCRWLLGPGLHLASTELSPGARDFLGLFLPRGSVELWYARLCIPGVGFGESSASERDSMVELLRFFGTGCWAPACVGDAFSCFTTGLSEVGDCSALGLRVQSELG